MSLQLPLVLIVDIGIASALAFALSVVDAPRGGLGLSQPILGLLLFVSTWVAILWAQGAYRERDRRSFQSDAGVVIRSLVWLAMATFAFLYLFWLPNVSRLYLLLLFGTLAIATLAGRLVLRWLLALGRRRWVA